MRFTDQTTPAPRREAALLLPPLMRTAAAAVMPTVRVSATPLPEESTEDTGTYALSATRGATGMLLPPRETPQSVSAMTHARIQDQHLNDIIVFVTQVPGISAQPGDTERVSFYARGFVVDNVLYDGLRTYPGAYSNDGKTQSDMAVFDRFEVIRGATGLMSGTGNRGASVDMIRKRSTAAFPGSVSASAETWNRYRADVDLSGPLNAAGTLRARVVGAESDGDSFVDLYHKRRAVGYGVLEYDLAPRTLPTVGIDQQSNRARGVTWGGLPAMFSDGTPTSFVCSTSTATRDCDWNEDTRNPFASVGTHLDNGWNVKASFNQFNSSHDARLSAWGGWAVCGIYPDRLTGAGALQFPGQFDERNVTRTLDLRASGFLSLGGRRHQAVVGVSGTRMSNAGDVYSPAAYPALSSSIHAWNHDDPIPAMHLSEHYTGVNADTGACGAVRLRPTDALSVIMGARVAATTRVMQGGYTLHYDFSRQQSAALAINNLFDKTYYSGTSFYSDVIYGDPRNVMLDLRWRF